MNILFILLFILLLQPRKSYLYCGIFGWIGESSDTFDFSKIKILGIFNDDRGGDGFGVFNGESLYKSVDPKLFKSALTNYAFFEKSFPKKHPIYLGHSRKKSSGAINIDHTQPIEYKKDGLITTLIHNGTIYNLDDVSKEVFGTNLFLSIPGILTDTMKLTVLIHTAKQRNISFAPILEKYTGAASIAIHFSTEPNSVYLFRGESQSYVGDNSLTEERPLYVIKSNKGFFFSSLSTPLLYIKDDSFKEDSKPFKLKRNVVFKFEGTSIEAVYKVDRTRALKYNYNRTANRRAVNAYANTAVFHRNTSNYNGGKTSNTSSKYAPAASTTEDTALLENGLLRNPTLDSLETIYMTLFDISNAYDKDDSLALDYVSRAISESHSIIKYASLIPKVDSNRITFFRGRYIEIRKYGDIKNKGNKLANGEYNLDNNGNIVPINTMGSHTYYFLFGVRVTANSFSFLEQEFTQEEGSAYISNPLIEFSDSFMGRRAFLKILKHSFYPINLLSDKNSLLLNVNESGYAVPYSGSFEPIFSKIFFNIKMGVVVSYYFNSSYGSDKKSQKEISNRIKELNDYESEVLYKCPACEGFSKNCKTCREDGYINAQEALEYEEPVVTAETSLSDNPPNKSEVIDNTEALIEEQTNIAVIDIIKSLGDSIEEKRNELNLLGDTTDLGKDFLELLDSIDTSSLKLLGYE